MPSSSTERRSTSPLPTPPLLVLTDRRASVLPLRAVVAAALAGGCRWFAVREKDLAPDGLADLVADVVALAKPYGATVLVAGVADAAAAARIARTSAAHGVHLPRDGDVAAARTALGPNALVGLSAHDLREVERAAAAGADYVTLSPVFASASKPGYGPALGRARLEAVARATDVPVLALGGIATRDDVAACRTAGAAGVVVMGAVARAGDPRSVVTELIEGWSA